MLKAGAQLGNFERGGRVPIFVIGRMRKSPEALAHLVVRVVIVVAAGGRVDPGDIAGYCPKGADCFTNSRLQVNFILMPSPLCIFKHEAVQFQCCQNILIISFMYIYHQKTQEDTDF